MRCRRLEKVTKNGVSHRNVIWFNSNGVREDALAQLFFTIYDTSGGGEAYESQYRRLDYTLFDKTDTEYDYGTFYWNEDYTDIIIDYIFVNFTSKTVTFSSSSFDAGIIYNITFDFDINEGDEGIDYQNFRIYITYTDSSNNKLYKGYINILNERVIPTFYPGLKNKNYSQENYAVKDSLTQRLSILKKELWYRSSYGLPLLDKVRNKGIIDAVILDIINSHPDVKNILAFKSEFNRATRHYSFSFVVKTIYTDESVYVDLSFLQ